MFSCSTWSDVEIALWVRVLSGWFPIRKLQFHLVILASVNDCCRTPLFIRCCEIVVFYFQHPSVSISCNSLLRIYPKVSTHIYINILSFLQVAYYVNTFFSALFLSLNIDPEDNFMAKSRSLPHSFLDSYYSSLWLYHLVIPSFLY